MLTASPYTTETCYYGFSGKFFGMPLYEYKCHSCGETFEVIQKFSDAPLEVHPKCGKGPVERLISPPALQFKGTGWYVTDYAGGNGKKQAAKENKPAKDGAKESSSSSSSSSKSESSTSKPSSSDKKV